jgi:hypothetical protein
VTVELLDRVRHTSYVVGITDGRPGRSLLQFSTDEE